jgi:hypothetical protein
MRTSFAMKTKIRAKKVQFYGSIYAKNSHLKHRFEQIFHIFMRLYAQAARAALSPFSDGL